MSDDDQIPPADSKALTEPDHLVTVKSDDTTSVTAQISNAMVGLKKRSTVAGPPRPRRSSTTTPMSSACLEGGLTRNEQTLLQAGEERLVRQFRLRFQEVMSGHESMAAIAEITGRKVLTFDSQILFDPPVAIEMFDPRSEGVVTAPARRPPASAREISGT